MTVLNTYLAQIISAVYDFGGTVNQVLGDGVMALFGAPIDALDHAPRAVARRDALCRRRWARW